MSDRGTIGARSVGGERRTPLRWLPWLGLALLALLALIAFLIVRNAGDAGDKPGLDFTNDRVGGATESGGASSGGQGTLTAGDRSLLPLSAAGPLAGLSGQAVTGKGVVESVVADEGFWAGSSPSDRIFVSLLLRPEAVAGSPPSRSAPASGWSWSGTCGQHRPTWPAWGWMTPKGRPSCAPRASTSRPTPCASAASDPTGPQSHTRYGKECAQ